ncbi:MAG: UDP-N-acetylglucosamine 2-epimerase, partial [Phycisphaerales bacterium]|nr:UDP-N-acetylglucosamine 2-epimerase [Phycisphaerales bacterium]
GGIPVAHIHGGDRAEGVADEAMRHAISKLAHLHLAATTSSAKRLERMGETEIHVVGSPALDELEMLGPLGDEAFESFGAPEVVMLLHPIGRHPEEEEHQASIVLDAIDDRLLVLAPNADPGRQGILRAYEHREVRLVEHLPREMFVGLLRRVATSGGVLVGNSSAALIEGAALGLPAVDVGPRQAGRTRCNNVVHATGLTVDEVRHAIEGARAIDRGTITHEYGNGTAGIRIAALLATTTPRLRKQNAY